MNYSEAKKVLEQQEKAKAILEDYKKVATAHEQFGFKSRREFIKALQEIDQGERSKGKSSRGRGLTPETIDQIRQLKAAGKTNAAIARTIGVSPLTVAKYVKAEGDTKAAPTKRRGKAKKK